MDLASAATAAAQSVAATSSLGATGSAAATSLAGQVGSFVATVVPEIAARVLPSSVTTTAPVGAAAVQIPHFLEVASAFAGGLAGALVGVRRQLDAIGVISLAVAAGLGGGIIRDLLLQRYGIYALENPRLLLAVLIAAVLAFFFVGAVSQVKPLLVVVDALALGLFACVGTDKALRAGLAVLPAILLGTITSVGGGMIRDVLTDEVPQVLRPGSLYATAAVLGAATYVSLVAWLNVVKPVATIAVILLVLGLRLLSEWLGWQSPMPTDLTPLVAAAPKKAFRASGRGISWTRRMLGAPSSRARGEDVASDESAAGEDDGRSEGSEDQE